MDEASSEISAVALHCMRRGVMVIAVTAVTDPSFTRPTSGSSSSYQARIIIIIVYSGRTAACTMGYGWIPVASPSLVKRARWQDPPAHRAQSYPARVP